VFKLRSNTDTASVSKQHRTSILMMPMLLLTSSPTSLHLKVQLKKTWQLVPFLHLRAPGTCGMMRALREAHDVVTIA